MAGLSVLLETHSSKSHPGRKAPATAAQIISKATLMVHGPSHKQKQVPAVVPATAAAAGSFLQRCFLCHRELAEGMDIYMYRGDRAFCSEECRCRQIFMDENAAVTGNGNGNGAGASTVPVPVRGRRRVAGRGHVAY